MFGYRLVRDADFDRTVTAVAGLASRVQELLLERAELTGQVAAAKARGDYATLRMNVLEREVALQRQRETGVPQLIATVETEAADPLGEALASLEDVGDRRAHELASRGLLHDGEDLAAFPSAATLAPGGDEE